jgi:hypothetical protein
VYAPPPLVLKIAAGDRLRAAFFGTFFAAAFLAIIVEQVSFL